MSTFPQRRFMIAVKWGIKDEVFGLLASLILVQWHRPSAVRILRCLAGALDCILLGSEYPSSLRWFLLSSFGPLSNLVERGGIASCRFGS